MHDDVSVLVIVNHAVMHQFILEISLLQTVDAAHTFIGKTRNRMKEVGDVKLGFFNLEIQATLVSFIGQ